MFSGDKFEALYLLADKMKTQLPQVVKICADFPISDLLTWPM